MDVFRNKSGPSKRKARKGSVELSSLTLLCPLGEGAFSSCFAAQDREGNVVALKLVKEAYALEVKQEAVQDAALLSGLHEALAEGEIFDAIDGMHAQSFTKTANLMRRQSRVHMRVHPAQQAVLERFELESGALQGTAIGHGGPGSMMVGVVMPLAACSMQQVIKLAEARASVSPADLRNFLLLVAYVAQQSVAIIDQLLRVGMCHRDIKPANMLVFIEEKTGKATVKACDFAFTMHTHRNGTPQARKAMAGTPGYIHPAHARIYMQEQEQMHLAAAREDVVVQQASEAHSLQAVQLPYTIDVHAAGVTIAQMCGLVGHGPPMSDSIIDAVCRKVDEERVIALRRGCQPHAGAGAFYAQYLIHLAQEPKQHMHSLMELTNTFSGDVLGADRDVQKLLSMLRAFVSVACQDLLDDAPETTSFKTLSNTPSYSTSISSRTTATRVSSTGNNTNTAAVAAAAAQVAPSPSHLPLLLRLLFKGAQPPLQLPHSAAKAAATASLHTARDRVATLQRVLTDVIGSAELQEGHAVLAQYASLLRAQLQDTINAAVERVQEQKQMERTQAAYAAALASEAGPEATAGKQREHHCTLVSRGSGWRFLQRSKAFVRRPEAGADCAQLTGTVPQPPSQVLQPVPEDVHGSPSHVPMRRVVHMHVMQEEVVEAAVRAAGCGGGLVMGLDLHAAMEARMQELALKARGAQAQVIQEEEEGQEVAATPVYATPVSAPLRIIVESPDHHMSISPSSDCHASADADADAAGAAEFETEERCSVMTTPSSTRTSLFSRLSGASSRLSGLSRWSGPTRGSPSQRSRLVSACPSSRNSMSPNSPQPDAGIGMHFTGCMQGAPRSSAPALAAAGMSSSSSSSRCRVSPGLQAYSSRLRRATMAGVACNRVEEGVPFAGMHGGDDALYEWTEQDAVAEEEIEGASGSGGGMHGAAVREQSSRTDSVATHPVPVQHTVGPVGTRVATARAVIILGQGSHYLGEAAATGIEVAGSSFAKHLQQGQACSGKPAARPPSMHVMQEEATGRRIRWLQWMFSCMQPPLVL